MNVQLKVLLILTLTGAKCQTEHEGFEDNKKEAEDRSDSHRRYDVERFNKDFDDDEWHVEHLKYAQMDGRRDCAGDTFKDKARRYRKTLQNDGALVQFVSSDPIPFNVSDLLEDSCKLVPEVSNIEQKQNNKLVNESNKHSTPPLITDAQTANDTKALRVIQNLSDTTDPVSKKDMNYQATTPTITVKVDTDDRSKEDDDGEKEKVLKSRRGTEYMFSSVEYYDEIPDFSSSICPDAVDVIELEIDELRSYDVECERLVEWRSLNE